MRTSRSGPSDGFAAAPLRRSLAALGRHRASGMTLVELLVAFAIFILLVGMLVMLTTTGLETWRTGERRKDAFDRAQRVLEQLTQDLSGLYADNQWYVVQGRRQEHAGLYCDLDTRGIQRLRFVHAGRLSNLRHRDDPYRMMERLGQGHFTDLWEIAYLLNPDGVSPGLYRGVRAFDRQPRTLLHGEALETTKAKVWTDSFSLLDPGVLWIGYRFWTQYTTTWDLTAPLKQAPPQMKLADSRRGEGVKVGPSLYWDSSRSRVRDFKTLNRGLEDDDPDFVYPEIVQIMVVIEAQTGAVSAVQLADAIDKSATTLRVSNARDLPDADRELPQYVLVGKEWIEYRMKSGLELLECRRGMRGTKAQEHEAGTPVRFGETFVTDVAIPAYREAVR